MTPEPAPRRLLFLRPAGGEIHLQDDAPEVRWPIARPVDLTKTHGIDLTAERLAQIAADYDPQLEEAALNFDHTQGGPAHGWVRRVEFEDGLLWLVVGDLDDELRREVKARRYKRASAEIDPEHPATGRPYLTGCAVLGALSPAVWGVPNLALQRKQKETAMPETDPTPPEKPTPPAPAESEALRQERLELSRQKAQLRRERAELAVDRALTARARRIAPALYRAGLRELLIALHAQGSGCTIRLERQPTTTAGDPAGEPDTGETDSPAVLERPAYEVLIACLDAIPELQTKTLGELLGGGGEEPAEPPAEQAALARLGLDTQRVATLAARYRLNL